MERAEQGPRVEGIFTADPDVGRDLAAVDWASTPLGPPETWSQSLCSAVGTVLSSRFSMWMAWGPALTFFCNAAYRRDTLGRKYPWALGRPATEVWAEIWPDIGPRIDVVLATGEATWDEALQLFLERSDYVEETYHTFSYSPLRDDNGAITGMLCVVSEVTDQVIAERRMRTLRNLGSDPSALRSERDALAFACEQLAADLHTLPFTLLYLFDEDAPTAYLAGSTGMPSRNSAAPAVLELADVTAPWPARDLAAGESAVVVLGDRFTDLPTGAWAEPPTRALAIPLPRQGGGRPYGFLVAALDRYRPLDEGYRDFVHLVAGQLGAAIANSRARDADRRRAEELAELDEAKTAFFTNVSHELRTPLTLLLAPAEDALADADEPLPAGQRRRIELIDRNARRLLGLVNTLLDFSRLASGQAAGHFVATDLARHTADLVAMFETAAERAGLSLTVDAPPLPEPVYVDREMWAKIVLNLLSNALKFTFSGGITVRLHTVGAGAGVELAVADTGEGIAREDQAHLFERFRRFSRTRSRSHEGSGIGLALVAELAALHGATVGLESTPGVGSTFTVRLRFGADHLPAEQVVQDPGDVEPVVTSQLEGIVTEALRWLRNDGVSPASPTPGAHATRAPSGAPPRVLVVDDTPDMREYLVGLLRADYQVETAVDGLRALERARTDPPDLVLTDVMMPNLDGFGLLAALRREPATTAIPVVMLSARADEDGTVEGLEAGADDYLAKPFTARELRARVRANLELDRSRRMQAELERQQALLNQAERLARVGSWELDLDGRWVHGSAEYFQLLGTNAETLRTGGLPAALATVHPDDRAATSAAVQAAFAGEPLDLELRLLGGEEGLRLVHARAHLHRDGDGRPVSLRGSLQDITSQRAAEHELAAAAAAREAAAREHQIADALQRSLLPRERYFPDHLRISVLYRPGVQGTQVGGDWYDVIGLGAGRTALVIGDVMGRGVAAAAVMGQLRAAARAYARLDLAPADVLELLDTAVRDLGEEQIVTCIYAVYDPADRSLTYANAGHLAPLMRMPDGGVQRLHGATSPPLGTGAVVAAEVRVELAPGALLALYTDGLVEDRTRDLDEGVDALAAELASVGGALEGRVEHLLDALWPGGPDDDVALLIAQVPEEPEDAMAVRRRIEPSPRAVADARSFVTATLTSWSVPEDRIGDAVLLASELVTNALVHGRPPLDLRLRRNARSLVLEVEDRATHLPRRLRPTLDDEHGRGLQIVAALSDQWGTRPTAHGKAVWCQLSLGIVRA